MQSLFFALASTKKYYLSFFIFHFFHLSFVNGKISIEKSPSQFKKLHSVNENFPFLFAHFQEISGIFMFILIIFPSCDSTTT